MDYNPRQIEQKWRQFWDANEIYKVSNDTDKPKFYVLDMFPYPSGSGLHVGHPLGYIASDVFARYKRHKGFNVLHPMGYDAFGLPAEQYAIQTGVHPAKSTAENVERYREQLDNIGFSFDWSREVQTCDPKYYKWTQWLFLQLFDSYYDNDTNKAEGIEALKQKFTEVGNATVNAATTQEEAFTAAEWTAMTAAEQEEILMNYRLAYRKVGHVNWCEELGTVLANDEVKDGVSERGGYPVERRAMLQWSLRITAYAERMLNSLDNLEWTDSLKAQQRNWIGRSEGATVFFDIANSSDKIEVFTTRPDTVFGVTFMVLAPEHDLVKEITTAEQQAEIDKYLDYVNARSDIERMAEAKDVTGAFTGAYAINPFTNTQIPIYIGEYVLKDYGTGAIMAVPSDDDRDERFATKFGIDIIQVVDKSDYPDATNDDKIGKIINSDFLNGMEVKEAIVAAIDAAEAKGIGQRKINYRLRDANYSRQRYWGEPFPIHYKDGVSIAATNEELPLELPDLDDYKPASGGKSPLARLDNWVNLEDGSIRETDTMPGFAGSSWYFLRYMDAHNEEAFAGKDALNYWQDVDLYVGGTEHAVGHLMYSRFWHKVLFDKGLVPTNEPFKKLINQGMIQGRSNFVYRVNEQFAEQVFKEKLTEYGLDFQTEFPVAGGYVDFALPEHKLAIEIKSSSDLKRYLEESKARYDEEGWKLLVIPTQEIGKYYFNFDLIIKRINRAIEGSIDNSHLEEEYTHPLFISADVVQEKNADKLVTPIHVDVNIVNNDVLDMEAFQQWRPEYKNAVFVTNTEGKYICGHAVEKMSKSKHNVVNPDLMVEKYGADCFRMYEMFLGPIEQSKPWNTHGIEGVSKFLRKFWALFFDKNENFTVSDAAPTKAENKILHTAIKKITEDIERFSLNTCVSAYMVCVNDLKAEKSNNKAVLQQLTVLLAPFAPHIAEELWQKLGNEGTVMNAEFPVFNAEFLKEDSFTYPIAINGKTRTTVDFPADATKAEIEKAALANERVIKYTEGKTIRKVIVVPKRMVNIVVG